MTSKWTKEKCHNVALEYNNRSEFGKKSKGAYIAACRMNILNDICLHMIKKKKQEYYTKEKCHKEALKYNTRGDFKNYSSQYYNKALRSKWMDDICSHMTHINTYWNYDKCKNEALKYDHRNDFQKNSKGAYAFANKNKLLNDICSHMIKIGNREFRCIYVFEFENNIAYIGLTYNILSREIDHKRKGPVYKHIKKTNSSYKLIQLTDYIKKEEAQKIEELTILEYENNGWKLLNTNYNSTLGGSIIFWTYEKCKEEALKYKHKTEFQKNSSGAYNSAYKNKWLNKICSHMIFNKPDNYWNDNEFDFLLKNHNKGFRYCAKELNRSYYSVKSQYQKIKNKL